MDYLKSPSRSNLGWMEYYKLKALVSSKNIYKKLLRISSFCCICVFYENLENIEIIDYFGNYIRLLKSV